MITANVSAGHGSGLRLVIVGLELLVCEIEVNMVVLVIPLGKL